MTITILRTQYPQAETMLLGKMLCIEDLLQDLDVSKFLKFPP